MPDDRQEQQLSAEVVAQKGFGTSRRGFDRDEVRAFLTRVAEQLRALSAREHQLQVQLRDAEDRAAHPDIDEASLFGEETARILRSAQEAAADIRAKAEEHAQKVLEEAHQQSTGMRREAESILDARTQEAANAAEVLRREAEQEAERIAARAQAEAEALMATANARAQNTVQEAETTRDRVLNDLARRRLVAATQVEQLRAGRERLLDAYRTVRRTLEEVTDDLQRADAEARAAAEAAGRRPPPPEAVTEAYPAAPEAQTPAEPEAVAEPEAAGEPEAVARAETVPTAEGVPTPEAVAEPEPAEAVVTNEEPPGLDIVEPPSADEGVRIIRPESPPRQVDEVFARIRADRVGAVDEAPPAEGEQPAEEAEAAVTDTDESLLQQREVALEKVEASLARKLKRALQDEQNELLDRLRGLKAKPAANLVLPDASVHAERYASASRELLGRAAGAGAEAVGAGGGLEAAPSLDDLASELAVAIVDPLRRRLERAFTDGHDDDPSVLAERLGAAYREWKTQRIEKVAADHVVAAFTRGTFTALPEGTAVRWVVFDVDGPCPDCDDNVLAGAIPKGEAFPTGQLYPPAHAGCHCLLAVEVISAE